MERIIKLTLALFIAVMIYYSSQDNVTITKPSRAISSSPTASAVVKRTPKTNKESSSSINKDFKKTILEIQKKLGATSPVTVKITSLDKIVYHLGANSRNVTKALVSITKKSGERSQFNALIDEKSGHILKTWNQTRLEHKKPVVLSSKGKAFYGTKIDL